MIKAIILYTTSLFFTLSVFGQNISEKQLRIKDSLELEKLTAGIDKFYTDPLRFQKDLPVALKLINTNLYKNTDNAFLSNKKLRVLRYLNYFLRRGNKDSLRIRSLNEYKTLSEKMLDSQNLSIAYRQLSTFWRDNQNYDKCYENINKAIQIATKSSDTVGEIISKSVKLRSMHFERFKEKNLVFNDSILKEYITLYNYSKKIDKTEAIKSLLVKIVNLFFRDKRYKESEAFIFQLEKIAIAQNDELLLKSLSRKLGTYYKRAKKNIPKAIPYYQRSILLNEKLKDTVSLIYSYLGMSNTYKSLGKYEEALSYYKKYTTCIKARNDINNFRKTVKLESELNLKHSKKMDSLKFAEEKNKIVIEKENQELKTQLYLTLFVICIIFMSFLAFYGYKLFKGIKKRNKEKESRLSITINKLSDKVSSKEEETKELLKETIFHLKTKKKLAEDLSNIPQQEKGASLKSIIADLKADKLEDNKLIILKENIEMINYDFVRNLKEKHPDLTKTDIEICSLVKLGLSRNEIIKFRSTTLAAIKSTRNRLRKKLQLSETQSLDEYIKSI